MTSRKEISATNCFSLDLLDLLSLIDLEAAVVLAPAIVGLFADGNRLAGFWNGLAVGSHHINSRSLLTICSAL